MGRVDEGGGTALREEGKRVGRVGRWGEGVVCAVCTYLSSRKTKRKT